MNENRIELWLRPYTWWCSEWTLDTSTTTLDIIRPGDQAKCSLCQDGIEEVPSRRETACVVVGIITPILGMEPVNRTCPERLRRMRNEIMVLNGSNSYVDDILTS